MTGMLCEQGAMIGRFTVRRLMGELGVMGKQAGSHAYKRTTARRIDMSNRLNRQFDVGYTEPVLGWP